MIVSGNDVELRYGYTLASLSGIAKKAVAESRWEYLPFYERYELAWAAIVEELYAANEPPRVHDLIRIGERAIRREVDAEGKMRGVYYYRSGKPAMPRFEAYWWSQACPTPSPENRVVESLAVWQVYDSINPTHQQVLMALAVHGTYERAAEAIGVTPKSFHTYVWRARKEFLRRWHGDETPSGFWGRDHREKERRNSVTFITVRRRRRRRQQATADDRRLDRQEIDAATYTSRSGEIAARQ